VLATEIIEELERKVHEFGDGEGQIPDPIQAWWYNVDRIEYEPGERVFRFVSDR
jgi:hypothetical protein